MATSMQSNPVYYSLSSLSTGQKSSTRTVVLRKGPEHKGFGVYLGEDVPSGLYVVTVERNSPASEANIQPGDRVLAINGQSISSTVTNPKDMVVQAAQNSDTLTFTIQSTDIFQTLQQPLTNNHSENNNTDNYSKQQQPQLPPPPPSKRKVNASTDLESYLKSLFVNEDIQIIPSSKHNNEFILTSNPQRTSSIASNSLPNRHSYRDDHNQQSHQHDHHRRPHRPKQKILVTKETQTSPNEDDDDEDTTQKPVQASSIRQYSLHPVMGTSQRNRTQLINSANESLESNSSRTNKSSESTAIPSFSTPSDKADNSNEKPHSTAHIVDIVGAAIAAERNRNQTNTRDALPRQQPSARDTNAPEKTSSRDAHPRQQPSARDTNARDQATSRDAHSQEQPSSRDKAGDNTKTVTQSRDQNPPPPYTTTDVGNTTSEPTQGLTPVDKGAYNVRNAQEDRESVKTDSAIPSDRRQGLHEVHLHRSSSFEGFGFHLQYNKSYYLVHRVEEGSPAEQAGLFANDVILKINQQSTEKMAHGQFVQIVSASSDVIFVVQHIDEYLRLNPTPPRNPQVASAISAAITEEGDKRKSGISKALNKLSTR